MNRSDWVLVSTGRTKRPLFVWVNNRGALSYTTQISEAARFVTKSAALVAIGEGFSGAPEPVQIKRLPIEVRKGVTL